MHSKIHAQKKTSTEDEVSRAAKMSLPKYMEFLVCQFNPENNASIKSMADMDGVVDQQERVINVITSPV